MSRFDRILNYLVLSLVVTVSLLWGAFDTWAPNQADLPRVLGFLLGLMAAATIHTWTRYSDLRKDVDKLVGEVGRVSDASGRLVDAMEQQVVKHTFSEAFTFAYKTCPHVGRLRIYAITTDIIKTQFWTLPFKVDSCEILLFEPPQSDGKSLALADRINVAIEEWTELQRNGQIKELRIQRYGDFPTHYFVVFDDRFALWGTYHRVPYHTGTSASDPFVISGSHAGTRSLIAELTGWFDGAAAGGRKPTIVIT